MNTKIAALSTLQKLPPPFASWSKKMAVVAGQVRVAHGDGGEVVAVQEELVVREGEKAGEARLERHERMLVAVPGEDGNVAVTERVRVQAVDIEVGEV